MTLPPRLISLRRRLAGMRRRILPGLTAANPFELYLIALVILGGVPLLLGGAAPVSLAAVVARVWTLLWGLELVAGGTLTLLGLLRNRSTWRVAGLKTLSWASFAYALAILVRVVPGSPAALGYIIGFAIACFAQARHVTRAAHTLDRYQTRVDHGSDHQ